MKKLFKVSVTVLLLMSVFQVSVFANGINDQEKVVEKEFISSQKVNIDRKINKDFELIEYEDGGNKVYTFNEKMDPETSKIAMRYINTILGDVNVQTDVDRGHNEGTYYGNSTGYDTNNAVAYTWANTDASWNYPFNSWNARAWGGSSAGWFGNNFDYLKLVQQVTVNKYGIGGTISWPPSLNITYSSSTKGWISERYNSSGTVGAKHDDILISGTLGVNSLSSIIYQDGGDIYLTSGSTIYKPRTYLKFYNW